LWLASYGDNALVELDAESGTILRTLEASPDLPLNEPVGVAHTKNSLWVLNHHNSVLLQIDQRTGKLTHTTTFPGDAAAGPFLVDHALWIAMTAQGTLHQVDPATGKIVGRAIQVPTGLCLWESVVGHDIWATSIKFGDFSCTDGTSQIDTASGQVTSLVSAQGKSLYTITRYANRLWATDLHKTLYQIDPRTGALRTAMTFDTNDTSHLFSAFGSMWVTQPEAGTLLHLRMP
jgi:glutamine cyclotransferase